MDIEQFEHMRLECQNLSILYVEDDLIIQESVFQLLNRVFNNIELSKNGRDAWEKFERNTYDIIITDLHLPYIDGVTLSRKIILKKPEQSIFIITANNDSSNLTRLINIGISGIVIKPIIPDVFLSLLFNNSKKILKKKKEVSTIPSVYSNKSEFSKLNSSLFKILKNESKKALIKIQIKNFDELTKIYSDIELNEILIKVESILDEKTKFYKFELCRVSFIEFILFKDVYNNSENLLKDIAIEIGNLFDNHVLENKHDDKEHFIETAIGITLGRSSLLKKVMTAVQIAKDRNIQYFFYQNNQNYEKEKLEKFKLKKFLKRAIKNDLVIPVFQPITSKDKKITKYEVLMRIKKDINNSELILPFEFLSIAKENYLYNQLSEIVIYKVISIMKKTNINISINFSYFDILNQPLIEKIESMIIKYNVANRLVFEITEDEMIENLELLDLFIYRFKKIGVKIAIDDFGSGYSNFDMIFKVKPDYIKIDATLIKNILNDETSYKIVKTLIHLAHSLDITVIAEYVSSKEIFDLLCELNVDEFQGHYLGHPLFDILKMDTLERKN